MYLKNIMGLRYNYNTIGNFPFRPTCISCISLFCHMLENSDGNFVQENPYQGLAAEHKYNNNILLRDDGMQALIYDQRI